MIMNNDNSIRHDTLQSMSNERKKKKRIAQDEEARKR